MVESRNEDAARVAILMLADLVQLAPRRNLVSSSAQCPASAVRLERHRACKKRPCKQTGILRGSVNRLKVASNAPSINLLPKLLKQDLRDAKAKARAFEWLPRDWGLLGLQGHGSETRANEGAVHFLRARATFPNRPHHQ